MKQEAQFEQFKIPGHNVTVPIMNLHGKQYLQVAQRVLWFNLEKADWIVETQIEREWEMQTKDGPITLVRFVCKIADPEGKVKRIARKTKVVESEKDYESAETGAVGRALSFLGYGTAYGEDLEEDDVVDSPQPAVKPSKAPNKPKETVQPKNRMDHPFKDHKADGGVFVGKTFEQIFQVDQACGFKWTKQRHAEFKDGKETPWVTDYLVYAQDSGLALE